MGADFAPFAEKMRAEGLPEPAIRSFAHYYAELAAGAAGTLSRREIEPVEAIESADALAGLEPAGHAALARTVVVKLNGGLGTTMGMRRAKSLLPVREGLCFLDVIARQVLELRRAHACRVPLVLMNSFRTQGDSRAALAAYPELAGELPLDFLQHKVPRIAAADLTPLRWPADPELEWCPPGHGDLYLALETSGLLGRLLDAGFRTAFVSNADNLGASLDLAILGWFASQGLPFAMEVCDRTPAHRKGGHLARRRGGEGLVLREIAQCPPDELDSFQDVSLYRYFNTNNLWVDLEALAGALRARDGVLPLPMIRNEKPVDPADAASPRGIQLETAMGAAISIFPGARALRVAGDRFAPVKTTGDLLAVGSDAFALTPDWRVVPSAGRAGELLVDLDPLHFGRIDQLAERFPAGPPSLVACKRLAVRGDVRFGAAVVCRGEVSVRAAAPGPCTIPDGARLAGEVEAAPARG
jgi:UTP--glucose-1-phosphate uridylyltransferase